MTVLNNNKTWRTVRWNLMDPRAAAGCQQLGRHLGRQLSAELCFFLCRPQLVVDVGNGSWNGSWRGQEEQRRSEFARRLLGLGRRRRQQQRRRIRNRVTPHRVEYLWFTEHYFFSIVFLFFFFGAKLSFSIKKKETKQKRKHVPTSFFLCSSSIDDNSRLMSSFASFIRLFMRSKWVLLVPTSRE